jgi:hypothetical protein
MLEPDEIRARCHDFRHGEHKTTTDGDVRLIENEVAEYRAKFLTERRPQLPPEELRQWLPLMGWLIYEASWTALRKVRAGFPKLTGDKHETSRHAFDQVVRIADAARQLIWPEFAPRALGAIRAHALAASKYDTGESYDTAYRVHEEANEKIRMYRDALGPDPACAPLVLQLDEMLIQLALAETGTACRFPEQGIGRWNELNPNGTLDDERRWVQRMYRNLAGGVETGMRALEAAQRINDQYGLIHQEEVDEFRMAMITSFRNPGVMTARAALLMLSLAPAMEDMGRRPVRATTWPQEREDLKRTFAEAYDAITNEVQDTKGNPVDMDDDHLRAQHQLRLNVALLVPGFPLPDPLDDAEVEAESKWLMSEENGGGPKNGNLMGAALMPLFIQSVVALRSLTGEGAGYAAWRARYPRLGRYAEEGNRPALIAAAMATAAGRDSLHISAE